ncbi:hypothetical protein JTE90_021023, partial [Oedothorax gibbosus]
MQLVYPSPDPPANWTIETPPRKDAASYFTCLTSSETSEKEILCSVGWRAM